MRPEHPLPSENELRSHIEQYHHISIDERLERYKFVWREFGPPYGEVLFMGGPTAWWALEEMRHCYIEGCYLACILLGQIFIEQSLANLYIIYGEEKLAEQGFKKLIDKALSDSQISSEIATQLHELRQIRNSYVHLSAGAGARTFMGRLVAKQRLSPNDFLPQDLMKEDAETAIKCIVDFLRDNERRSEHSSEPSQANT
jgi:hypothetical protein